MKFEAVLIFTLFLSLTILTSTANAASALCYRNPDVRVYNLRACPKGWTLLNAKNFKTLLGGSSCTSCQINLAGTWQYVIQKSNSNWTSYNVTLTKSGTYYTGKNTSHTVMATTVNRDIKVTLAVSGEEIEGWALHAEGHVYGKNSDKIVAIFHDSQGNTGSLTAWKQ